MAVARDSSRPGGPLAPFCLIEPIDTTKAFFKRGNNVVDFTSGAVLWDGPNDGSPELCSRVGDFAVNRVNAKVLLVDY